MEQKLESDPRRKLRPQANPHRLSNFSPLLPLSSLNTRQPAPCCILSPSISLCIFCPWTTHIRGHKPHTWNKELRGRCRLDKIKKSEPGMAVQAWRTELEYQNPGKGWFWWCTGDAGTGGPCSRLASQSSWISELQAKTHKTRCLAAAEWHISLFSGLHMHIHTCTPARTYTRTHKHIQNTEKHTNQKPLGSIF